MHAKDGPQEYPLQAGCALLQLLYTLVITEASRHNVILFTTHVIDSVQAMCTKSVRKDTAGLEPLTAKALAGQSEARKTLGHIIPLTGEPTLQYLLTWVSALCDCQL